MTRINAGGGQGAQPAPMVETIDGWRCIGCGRIAAERPCIGICQDRRVELVEAAAYAELAWRVGELEAALATIAHVTPKPGALEAAWTAMQARARALLRGAAD